MAKSNKKVVKLCLLENIFKNNLHSYEVVNKLTNPLNINLNNSYSIFKRLTEARYFKTNKFSYILPLEKLLLVENRL